MIPSGGATFPFPTKTADGSTELRDLFAAAALTGLIINNLGGTIPVERDAITAYAYADAMLKEREQRR